MDGSRLSNELEEPLVKGYKVYPARWVVLSIFCLLSAMNAVLWISFAPVNDKASDFFDDIGDTAINFLALSFQILYVPGTVLSIYIMDRYSMRTALLIGGGLTFLGSLIRYGGVLMIDDWSGKSCYAIVFVGQCFAGIAQPFFVNLPAKLASNWFSLSERDVATTIASLFNPLGNAIGQGVPPLFVSGSGYGHIDGMDSLMLSQVIMAGVPFLLSMVYIQSTPPTPPSRSTQLRLEKERRLREEGEEENESASSFQKMKNDFSEICADRDFMILCVTFSIGLGLFNALLTVINQILSPYGYSNEEAGNFGAVLVVSGLIGAAICAVYLDITHNYRPALKGGFSLAGLSTLFFVLALQKNETNLMYVVFALMGLCMIPLLPSTMENAAECTYPIPEELSTGVLLIGGNILGIPIVLILEQFADQTDYTEPFTPAKIFCFCLVVVAIIVLWFYQGEYKRLQADQERRHSVEERSRSGSIAQETLDTLKGERRSSYDHDFRDPLILSEAVEEALAVEDEVEGNEADF